MMRTKVLLSRGALIAAALLLLISAGSEASLVGDTVTFEIFFFDNDGPSTGLRQIGPPTPFTFTSIGSSTGGGLGVISFVATLVGPESFEVQLTNISPFPQNLNSLGFDLDSDGFADDIDADGFVDTGPITVVISDLDWITPEPGMVTGATVTNFTSPSWVINASALGPDSVEFVFDNAPIAAGATESFQLDIAVIHAARPCGDGIVDSGEDCDDGNNDSGDCCSASCQYEPSASVCSEAGICPIERCDGAGVCVPGSLPCDSVEVFPGRNQMVSLLGGSSVPGGIDIIFEDVTLGGTLVAEQSDDPGTTTFFLPGEPPLFWDITFSGEFSGNVTLVVGYDETTLDADVQESQLVLYHFIDSAWRPIVVRIVDTTANTITMTVESFSFFVLGILRSQEMNQQKCINALNKGLAKVAKAQGKENVGCVWSRARGKLIGTLEDCLTADRKGLVSRAQGKTLKCRVEPDFGPRDPNGVNAAALQKERELIRDVFGPDLDAAIVSAASDKSLSRCQVAVARQVQKCQDAHLQEFNKCKRAGLKGEAGPLGADLPFDDLTDLELCMGDDPEGEIGTACDTTLGGVLEVKCGGVSQASALPGACSDALDLKPCLETLVKCRVCGALNQADGLNRDCDVFGGVAPTGSCP